MILNDTLFEGKLNEIGSYFLGLLLADGGFHRNKPKVLTLKMKDKEMVESFQSALQSDNKITEIPAATHIIQGRKVNCCSQYVLPLWSEKIVSDLSLLGMSIDNRELLLHDDRIITSHYLRGFMDGDGCLSCRMRPGKRHLSFTVIFAGTLPMMKGLSFFLQENLKLTTWKIYQSHRTSKLWQFGMGKRASLALCEWMYRDSTIYLQRKKNIYLQVLNHDKLRQLRGNQLDCARLTDTVENTTE